MTRNRTLLWLLVPGSLSAQPIITTDNMPILGDVVPIGICSDPIDTVALNASAGAMMTWDFSGLTEQTEEQFLFVDPVGSLWENDFPTSSLCGISWDGSHAYYTTTSGMLEQDGLCTIVPGPPPEDTAKVLLTTDSESLMSLPLAFGDTHSDVFSGTFEAGGFIGAVDGTIDLVADGHGTLVLPNGTFSNVLRYRFDRVQNNTVLGTTTSTSKVQWGWVSEDHRYWLLLMEVDFNGFNPIELVWYSKVPPLVSGTGLADRSMETLTVWPNPVPAGGSLRLAGTGVPDRARLLLADATGRVVRTWSGPGTQFSLEGLVAGNYMLTVLDARGTRRSTSRIVVQ